MPIKPFITFHITTERLGDGPRPWAWLTFNEHAKMLIAPSQPKYAEQDQALGAGHVVAVAVRRKLELAHAREVTEAEKV